MTVRNGAAFDAVRKRQREWARRAGVLGGASSAWTLEANLLQPLRGDTLQEFESADGDELWGKMRALCSSAALVVNVLDFWRSRPAELAACMGFHGVTSIRFEQKYPLFNGIVPPPREDKDWAQANIDVEISGVSGTEAIVLECKFTEPFRYLEKSAKSFGPTYYRQATRSLWAGMEHTRELPIHLNAQLVQFEHLDPAQLIKTALACKRKFGTGRFKMIYVWFSVSDDQASIYECAALKLRRTTLSKKLTERSPYKFVLGRTFSLRSRKQRDPAMATILSTSKIVTSLSYLA